MAKSIYVCMYILYRVSDVFFGCYKYRGKLNTLLSIQSMKIWNWNFESPSRRYLGKTIISKAQKLFRLPNCTGFVHRNDYSSELSEHYSSSTTLIAIKRKALETLYLKILKLILYLYTIWKNLMTMYRPQKNLNLLLKKSIFECFSDIKKMFTFQNNLNSQRGYA